MPRSGSRVRVSFPAPSHDRQTFTDVCELLKKGASAPFFIPTIATEIHPQLPFLSDPSRHENTAGTATGWLPGLGGNLDEHVAAHLALDHAHGGREAQDTGIEPTRSGRLRHQLTNGEVRQQQASRISHAHPCPPHPNPQPREYWRFDQEKANPAELALDVWWRMVPPPNRRELKMAMARATEELRVNRSPQRQEQLQRLVGRRGESIALVEPRRSFVLRVHEQACAAHGLRRRAGAIHGVGQQQLTQALPLHT